MDADLLGKLRAAAAAIDAKKAFGLLALDVSARTSIAEAFVICSVSSTRQAQAVADEVGRAMATTGRKARSVEGYQQGSWVLMDFGDIVLHIFLEERRDHYALERLWGDAPAITPLLRAEAS
jgi:ribosome-associated protein